MSKSPYRLNGETGSIITQGAHAALTVSRPDQLAAALRQHERPVVIENTPANAKLKDDFDKLLKWQKWGLAALVFIVFIQMVMSNEYNLEALRYFKWNVYEVGGHITLRR
jgi:hypothetical protein